MADLRTIIESRLRPAFDALEPGADPVVRPSDHADFQANGALALAKKLGRSPRDVADEIVGTLDLSDLCVPLEVSGPGFINLTITTAFLAETIGSLGKDDRLGVDRAEQPERVVIDYSSPNVAKEMHVGHLRGTILGDALSRVLVFLGHDVIRENHIGDWGTPFGMLIEHLVDVGESEAVDELSLGDLEGFYQAARRSFESDGQFKERSRQRVVALQSGDPETLRLWHILVAESVQYFEEVYAKLGVLLMPEDIVGESFYDPMLNDVVAELDRLGLLVESDGARCVFPPGFVSREGEPLPLIVQKSDGGFGYAATDLAAIRDRVGRVGATRMLYVVGAPQAQHFAMCWAVARLAGWIPEGTDPVHVAFGNVLGSDHKMLKSRAGTSVKLVELLDEAIERARAAISGHAVSGDEKERPELARALGIGAVKYADLSTDRVRDYVFDWDRMLAFDGNTAPYLQYAHARIRSVFRRPDLGEVAEPATPQLAAPAERALAIAIVGFDEAVQSVVESNSPSKLTAYLYDLASTFTTFYESCPILKAETSEQRQSRLLLARLSADTLKLGLDLLGIEAPDRM